MDRQIRALMNVIEATAAPGVPALWQLTPDEARGAMHAFMAMFNEGGPAMAERRGVPVPGRRGSVRGVLHVPEGAPAVGPGILYLHGGGFVLGSPETHDRLARDLAHGSGARVLSLDYALAPEHPFPAGLDDCVDAARWLGAHGREVGIDAGRLLIGGDSAGANLAAATALRLRDEGWDGALRGALLVYGRFAEGETPSLAAWGERDLILSRRLMEWFDAHYRGAGVRPGDPYYAPLAAKLAGFPPSVLVVGTLDPLRSDSELFAAALAAAGVPAELHVVPDGIHAFVQMPSLDIARDALRTLCDFGRRCCA